MLTLTSHMNWWTPQLKVSRGGVKTAMVLILAYIFAPARLDAETQHSLMSAPNWLPQGKSIVIERVNHFPMKYFESEAEAKKWAADIKAQRVQIEPVAEYYRIWISDKGYVIRAYNLDENGELSSSKSFFVGIGEKSSWIYEEDPGANRLICVTNMPAQNIDAGPYSGLISTTKNFFSEFSHFGAYTLDSKTIRYDDSKLKSFTANTVNGISLSGTIKYNSGEPTNTGILNLYYSNSVTHMEGQSSTSFSNAIAKSCAVKVRNPLDEWVVSMEYIVKQEESLPKDFDIGEFYRQFTNKNTVAFQYDCARQVLIAKNSDGTVREYPKGRPTLSNNGNLVMKSKAYVLLFLAVSTAVGVWILFKSRVKQ
jgi:hypothetical protein